MDAIESLELDRRKQRAHIWDQWQKYLDHLDQILKDPTADFTESPTTLKVMRLNHHISGQVTRETNLTLIDLLRDVEVKKLSDSYIPGLKEFLPIFAQIIGGVAAAGIGCVPYAAGLTGSSATAVTGISSGVNAVLVSGGSSCGQMIHSVNQGLQSKEANTVEASKQILNDGKQQQQHANQAEGHGKSQDIENEKNRHQATQVVSAA